MSSGVIHRISQRMRSDSPDVKVVLWVIVLIAIFNTIYVAYHEGYEEAVSNVSREHNLTTISGDDPLRVTRRRITLSLIISCIGLFSRTLVGFTLSALSLAFAVKEFSSWYYHTAVNVKPYYTDWDVGLLVSGTWWDITVMLVVIMLLGWQVFMAASSIRRRCI